MQKRHRQARVAVLFAGQCLIRFFFGWLGGHAW